jgi:hypothetical protein
MGEPESGSAAREIANLILGAATFVAAVGFGWANLRKARPIPVLTVTDVRRDSQSVTKGGVPFYYVDFMLSTEGEGFLATGFAVTAFRNALFARFGWAGKNIPAPPQRGGTGFPQGVSREKPLQGIYYFEVVDPITTTHPHVMWGIQYDPRRRRKIQKRIVLDRH